MTACDLLLATWTATVPLGLMLPSSEGARYAHETLCRDLREAKARAMHVTLTKAISHRARRAVQEFRRTNCLGRCSFQPGRMQYD